MKASQQVFLGMNSREFSEGIGTFGCIHFRKNPLGIPSQIPDRIMLELHAEIDPEFSPRIQIYKSFLWFLEGFQ